MALNPLLRSIRKSSSFTDAELMVVYLLVSIASSIAGHDTLQILWALTHVSDLVRQSRKRMGRAVPPTYTGLADD